MGECAYIWNGYEGGGRLYMKWVWGGVPIYELGMTRGGGAYIWVDKWVNRWNATQIPYLEISKTTWRPGGEVGQWESLFNPLPDMFSIIIILILHLSSFFILILSTFFLYHSYTFTFLPFILIHSFYQSFSYFQISLLSFLEFIFQSLICTACIIIVFNTNYCSVLNWLDAKNKFSQLSIWALG